MPAIVWFVKIQRGLNRYWEEVGAWSVRPESAE